MQFYTRDTVLVPNWILIGKSIVVLVLLGAMVYTTVA